MDRRSALRATAGTALGPTGTALAPDAGGCGELFD
jgi:hypothetical protein